MISPITKIREQLHLTREEFSSELNIKYSALTNYERVVDGSLYRSPDLRCAWRLIDMCLKHGLKITLEEIYPRHFFIN